MGRSMLEGTLGCRFLLVPEHFELRVACHKQTQEMVCSIYLYSS
jgi:hypothetical protein